MMAIIFGQLPSDSLIIQRSYEQRTIERHNLHI